jgi:Fe-S cluster assembly protein SufB
MELSTYFRINAGNSGQFEQSPVIADNGAYVNTEGCTAPMRDENQLHATVVELVALGTRRSAMPRCRTGIRTRTELAGSTTS